MNNKEFNEYPFDLSVARSRYVDGNHKISQTVKSIRLGEFTDQTIRLRIIFPEGDERILRPEDVITIKEPRKGFIVENLVQTGKTVTIEASLEVELLPVKMAASQIPSNVGSNFSDALILPDVTVTPQLLIPASANRTMATVEHKGTIVWYAGSLAVLGHVDYKKLAKVINPGDILEWNNLAGLYFRTEAASDVTSFYLMDEVK